MSHQVHATCRPRYAEPHQDARRRREEQEQRGAAAALYRIEREERKNKIDDICKNAISMIFFKKKFFSQTPDSEVTKKVTGNFCQKLVTTSFQKLPIWFQKLPSGSTDFKFQ